jgi:sn-glycerol 3-phosphate transport system permease protein
MVERRPWLTALSHAVLLLGVAVVAFPVYLTFVASTPHRAAIVQAPDAAAARRPHWSRTTAGAAGGRRGGAGQGAGGAR